MIKEGMYLNGMMFYEIKLDEKENVAILKTSSGKTWYHAFNIFIGYTYYISF